MPILARSHFEGYIMSGHEGKSAGDALEKVSQYLEMERRILASVR